MFCIINNDLMIFCTRYFISNHGALYALFVSFLVLHVYGLVNIDIIQMYQTMLLNKIYLLVLNHIESEALECCTKQSNYFACA